MAFSDEQYLEAIASNSSVKEAFNEIKISCQRLQKDTGCPEEDIDEFLKFMQGKWK